MSLFRTHRNHITGGVSALLLLGASVVAVALVSGGSDSKSGSGSASGSGSEGSALTSPNDSQDVAIEADTVPWPKDGQTAVALEGGRSLGTRGEQRPVPIASLAKVMTAYVILKEHPLGPDEPGPQIEADRQAEHEVGVGGESTVPVRAGEKYSERQLLELMLIPSANNVARLLARWDSGTQEAFVKKMQRAADELGMDRSTYTGASGIEPTTVSTAVDQLKLAQRVMKDPVFRRIVASPTVTVPGMGPVSSSNSLLGTSGVVGLKTGSSTPAGGNLLWASEVRIGDRSRLLLGAVLHQQADTTPTGALHAALNSSRVLIDGIRDQLSPARTEAE